ncbi:UNVERIFIED_CONTAM: Chaperone protein dnaJ 50 [Sesamum latifolium]|uniref:Chaperone protein dnaJ 50 n=1 Tax=Sesamum latifolium TaxID=2727402 RepID=A0AAW2WND4_9LAMI
MEASASIRWCVPTLILLFSLLIQPSISIYCDEDDCYDLLGYVKLILKYNFKGLPKCQCLRDQEAYYKLSLKHHPDKNPDPESKKKFVKIANAYEILKDEATREQYDYAIAHPEEVFYNTARYYHAYYGHKTAVDMVKKTPAYKNKLKAMELERSGGVTNKKKGNKQINKKMEEELSEELELQIKGAEKPSFWELIGVRCILLPYTLGKLLLWYGCWFWRYQVKKAPYSWEDASYLTRRSLGVPSDSWRHVDELTKEDLVQRRLWEKPNLESYLAEMRKESKRRR